MPIRATDQDRTRAVTALDGAFARGALDTAEHEQRVGRAWAARDAGELVVLTRDLPGPGEAGRERLRRASDVREWLEEWRWWLGGAAIMLAIWGLQAVRSGPDFFWPVVPLGI